MSDNKVQATPVASAPPAASSTARAASPGPLPGVKTVEQRQASEKKKSPADNLPIIYVDAPKPGEKPKKIQVPTGGARVVFRGQDGQKVTMKPTGPTASKNSNVKVIRTARTGGVVVQQPQPQVQVIKTGGQNGNDQVIIVQQPQQQVIAQPYYGYGYGYPYRYGLFGGYPYGYGYGCGYGYGYGGFW